MSWHLLVVALLALSAQAFVPGPIRWTGHTEHAAKRFVLAPRDWPHTATASKMSVVAPQKLTIWDQGGSMFLNDVPYFKVEPSHLISWDGKLCLEAAGDAAGDAVHLNRCTGGLMQLWDFSPQENRQANQIRLQASANKCIDVNLQGGGLNGVSIELQECNKDTESWEFENSIPVKQNLWQKMTLASWTMPLSLLFAVGALGTLSLSALWWRQQKARTLAASEDNMPLSTDHGGVSLAVPLTGCHGSVPLRTTFDTSMQELLPAALTISAVAVEDGATTIDVPSGGYCESAESCVRRKTRTVWVGDVPVGSEHPIATQTMTTTVTHDVEATVAQVKRCADLGIDIVRVTVQGMKEAKACEHIKRRLIEDGYKTPIVADIHFTPKVALVVADFVDKVRVNPGNFADGRKSFDKITALTEDDITEARQAIEETLTPLVLKLKEQGKSMRIGVNHGSLSERILFQYGDTPEGMVASAMEFGEICRKLDFHNFIFSMKASNPRVMVNAYRALTRAMYKNGWDYPVHLGVTEAGGGSDGRIKSAAGIGALLLDGIGDTIRVSLTEDPEYEAEPCVSLRKTAVSALGKGIAPFEEPSGRQQDGVHMGWREGFFSRRSCEYPLDIPLNQDGSVFCLSTAKELSSLSISELCDRFGLRLRKDGDIQKDWKSVDAVVIDEPISEDVEQLKMLLDVPIGVLCRPNIDEPRSHRNGVTLMINAADAQEELPQRLGGYALICTGEETAEIVQAAIAKVSPRLILLKPESQEAVTFTGRRFLSRLKFIEGGDKLPVMFWFRYPQVQGQDEDDVIVQASAEFGSLFIDGFGEGILWDAEALSSNTLRESSFNLLQASRMRISKTEFISCPSCGRTLFNLQETTKKIQERTGHLPGVRIAVMGCIVNGPGEMADADFGYVGSVPGKIDLYRNYDCVKKGIPSEIAVDALVDLIKEHGMWQEPGSEDDEDESEDTTHATQRVLAVA